LICIVLFSSSANISIGVTQPSVSSASASNPTNTSYEMIQYPLPNGSSVPWELTTDKLGRVWVVEQGSNQLGMFNPSTSTFQEYSIPTPNSTPISVAVDSLGNVWVTELTADKLAELKNGSSQIVEYRIPNGTAPLGSLEEPLSCGPVNAVPGPSGDIWILCDFSNQIDEFFPNNSSFDSFDLPLWDSGPVGLVFGPSGNFWFTAADANELGNATVSDLQNGTDNGISEFAPINQTYIFNFAHPINLEGDTSNITSSLPTPAGIAISPNGQVLWITEHVDSSFDSYNIGTKSLDRYWLSQTYMQYGYSIAFPNALALDSNGNVWMAEHYGNKVAEFNPSTGQLTEYVVPCCTSTAAGIYWLSLGQNGTVWFVELYGNAIGELKPASTLGEDIDLGIQNDVLSVQKSQSVTVALQVKYSGLATGRDTEIELAIAGTSTNGTLVGVSAHFSPETFKVTQSGTVSTNLTLTDHSLKAGTYDLTISANLTASNIIYSRILQLTVPTSSPFQTRPFIDAAIIGAVASVLVVSTLSFVMRRRRR
jgi:streptogramin lyase